MANFPLRQPIGRLTDFLGQRHIHLAIETANELGAQFRRVIKPAQSDALAAGNLRIARKNFAFPLGLKKIPIGTNLARLQRLGMVGNILADVADIDEDVLVLRVDVVMLAEPPLGLIDDLGKDQRRTHAVQNFRAIKNFIGRRRPGDIGIDEIFPGAPLRHNLRRKRIAPPGGHDHVDLGIFFLKQLRHRAKLALALVDDRATASLLSLPPDRAFPLGLPVGFGFGGVSTLSDAAQTYQH